MFNLFPTIFRNNNKMNHMWYDLNSDTTLHAPLKPIASLALGQAIAIGQASTELDMTKILLATGAILITIAAFVAVLLFIVAKKYYAPTRDYGTREN